MSPEVLLLNHNVMKYIKIIFFLSAMVPLVALAQGTPGGAQTGSQFINFANNLLQTANILVTLFFVIALLVFAYGIIRFLMAAGDEGEVRSARGYILWGVVGMAVLASLFGLILFLRTVFGVQNDTGNIQAPNVTGSAVNGGGTTGGGGGGGGNPPPIPGGI